EVESRVGWGGLIGTVERATSIRTGCGPRSAASGTRWLGDDRPAPGRGTAFAHTCVTSSLDRFPQRGPSGDLIERPCDLGDDVRRQWNVPERVAELLTVGQTVPDDVLERVLDLGVGVLRVGQDPRVGDDGVGSGRARVRNPCP